MGGRKSQLGDREASSRRPRVRLEEGTGGRKSPPSNDHGVLVDDADLGELLHRRLMVVYVAVHDHQAKGVRVREVLNATVNVLGVKEVVAKPLRVRGIVSGGVEREATNELTRGRVRPKLRLLGNHT